MYASLVELGEPHQLLSVVDVGILVVCEGQLQLLQLLVAEGGAVAPPGGGGERPALPAQADGSGGLTQRPLPLGLPDICFQEEEEEKNESEAPAPVSRLRSPRTTGASATSFTNQRVNAHKNRRGLRRLHGSQCHRGT